jgi:hypothetical protein
MGNKPAKGNKKPLTQMSLTELKNLRKNRLSTKQFRRGAFTPSLPSVNLFPASVQEILEVRKLKKILTAAVVAVMLGIGGAWFTQGDSIITAEIDLSGAMAQQTQVQTQIRKLAPVKSLYDEITRTESVINSALSAQVTTSIIVQKLNELAAKNGIFLKTVSLKYSSGAVESEGKSAGGGCPIVDPFSTVISVGCASYTGIAGSRENIISFVDDIASEPLFVNVFTSKSSAGESGFAFSGSMNISPEGLAFPDLVVDTQVSAEQAEADKAFSSLEETAGTTDPNATDTTGTTDPNATDTTGTTDPNGTGN